MVKLQPKRLPVKSKTITRYYSNTATLEMSGKSTEMQLLEEHGPTNTIRLRLEQQLLPILVKGVNNLKGLQGRER